MRNITEELRSWKGRCANIKVTWLPIFNKTSGNFIFKNNFLMCFGSVISVTQEVLVVEIALGRCDYLPAPGEGGNSVRKCSSVTVAALSGNWHSLCLGMSYVNTVRSGEQLSSLLLLMWNLNTSSNSRLQWTQKKTSFFYYGRYLKEFSSKFLIIYCIPYVKITNSDLFQLIYWRQTVLFHIFGKCLSHLFLQSWGLY